MTRSRILLQTTIVPTVDDWGIQRFSMLRDLLAGLASADGDPLYDVTARDRGAPAGTTDTLLATLDTSDVEQLWLFAVDVGNGLNDEERAGIDRFRARGGGLFVARDHMDLGCSVCDLHEIGRAHHFHTHNPDPDPSRRMRDDPYTTDILWPNFHSGANGDFQEVTAVGALHPVLMDPDAPGAPLRYLPSHPHEGDVSAPPEDASARVIVSGKSIVTGHSFAIAVAFEPRPGVAGPALAQSTFHHFSDYNWNPVHGAPTFVSEAPGGKLPVTPEARRSVEAYVANVARWLGSAS